MLLFSIVESPQFPDFSALYKRLGLEEQRFDSVRKAIGGLKKKPPAIVVAEFVYGWSNNYSGVHISNLDVFLASLPKYGPDTRVIALAAKAELPYAEKLGGMFPLAAIEPLTVTESRMETLLRELVGE